MKTTITTSNANALRLAPVGSIIHDTMRPGDLFETFGNESEYVIEIFGNELEWQIQRNCAFLSMPENGRMRDRLNAVCGEALDAWQDDGKTLREDIDTRELIESLFDALNEFTPPYCFFGSRLGDEADYGYWPDMDSINKLPDVENSDEAAELGDDCKSVNDHGNVTVYSDNGSVMLELV